MSLLGHLDVVTRSRVSGWAFDPIRPGEPVVVTVSCAGRPVARLPAGDHRPDLAAAGYGEGRHGFDLVLPTPLGADRDVVVAVVDGSGRHLAGSPHVLEGPASFEAGGREAIARLVSGCADDDGLEARILFLEGQANALRQGRADRLYGLERRRLEHRLVRQDPSVLVEGAFGAGPAPRTPARRPLALVVDDRTPDASRDAGSNALLSHMRALSRLGYEVAFVPLDGSRAAIAPQGFAGGAPQVLSRPWYANLEEVLARHPRTFALVYLHRLSAARYAPLVRARQPGARIVYSLADLHWLRLSRQAAVEGRPDLAAHARHVRREEEALAGLVDAVLTHSCVEAGLLSRVLGAAGATSIHVVPWEVAAPGAARPLRERGDLVFVGGMAHAPNVDALMTLGATLMPALAARGGPSRCLVYGDGLPDALRAHVERSFPSTLALRGRVAAIADVFSGARCSLAPLAFGAGVKGKVLESLAHGVPCAMSAVAAEGLGLGPSLSWLVARDDAELAAKALRLMRDDALNDRLALEGVSFVRSFASRRRVDAALAAACGLAAVPRA